MSIDLSALIQLAASGNSKTVEEAWMAALEEHADDPAEVASWTPLLEKLAELDRVSEAEPLAWAALEAVRESAGAEKALEVAGPFLLALSRSDELKRQVADIYAAAYADRENLAVLLEEAGIGGGRPPRRALRTLEVCLHIAPGSYLVARHQDEPARVEAVDPTTWEVTVETPAGRRTLGPVQLADEYAPVEENDFRVLRQFAPDRLREMLAKEPARVVISILRAQGNHLNSNALAERLTPDPIPVAEWTKWWTRARAAIKRNPNLQITGRSPYEISYHAVAITIESETEARFKRTHDPVEQLDCIESYLRECKSRVREPDQEMLARFKKRIDQTARRQLRTGAADVLTTLLVSRRVLVATGVSEEEADRPVVEFLAAASEPTRYMKAVTSDALWPAACRCLKAAHPARYMDFCEALLLEAPTGACDLLAGDLLAGGFDGTRFDALVQRILRDPVQNVNALAWLWLGPVAELNVPLPPLPTLCAKLVAVAGEMKRRDELSREVKKNIQTRVREALSANQYARFKDCLTQTSAGVAETWRTRIARLDNLGRAVPEDLVKLIRAVFPDTRRTPPISPWKREDILYMTAAGRSKLAADIEELVNVKMRDNAKAIGEAAAHGDLSENSEYKFALEERDLLRARVAQLQEQWAQSAVLEPQEVPEDHVGFGTRVTLRTSESGETLQMTFLGPREADASQCIYNYKSPIGQKLMGLTPGDTVELSFGEYSGVYTLESVENSLRESSPSAQTGQ